MNANTRQFIMEQEALGQNAETVAAVLAADVRFAADITKTPLRALWTGTDIGVKLRAAMVDPDLDAELRNGIARVDLTVQFEDGLLETTDPVYAFKLRAGIAGLVQLKRLTQEEADAILAPAGGPFYDPLSVEEVQAEMDRLGRMSVADQTIIAAHVLLNMIRRAAAATEAELAPLIQAAQAQLETGEDQKLPNPPEIAELVIAFSNGMVA